MSRRDLYEGRQLPAIAARWDARAAAWDRELDDPACHLNADDAYRRFLRAIRRVIAGRRKFCAAHGVVDAGCGTGLVLAAVVPAFAWGVGVDLSPEMIRAAEAKRIEKARFTVGDGFKLATLAPPVGAVLSRGVLLSHYGRRQGEALLAAARAALAPGGFLVFDFLNTAAQGRHSPAVAEKTHFTRAEMLSLAGRAGFRTATILGEDVRRVLLLLAEGP